MRIQYEHQDIRYEISLWGKGVVVKIKRSSGNETWFTWNSIAFDLPIEVKDYFCKCLKLKAFW